MSQKINEKLGYELLPRGIGDYNLYSLVPLNKLKSAQLAVLLLASSKAFKPIGSTISQTAKFMCRRLKARKQNISHAYRVQKISYADESFDLLWEETKGLYPNTNVRNAEILNWYLLPTQYANREIYACYKKDELTGFIVVRTSSYKRIPFMLCVDLWVRSEDEYETISSLLVFAKDEAQRKSLKAFVVPHFSNHLSNTFYNLDFYNLLGKKRNDYFSVPEKHYKNMSNGEIYLTYINGDRFLGKYII
jgi:hypothetical protein